MDKKVIGRRIRRQRENLSLTRDEFSERMEISPQFLAEIENGTKGMSAETLFKMCDKFNISADYILLGRQSMDGLQTSGAKLLAKIPAQYSEAVEELLRAFLAAITMAASES